MFAQNFYCEIRVIKNHNLSYLSGNLFSESFIWLFVQSGMIHFLPWTLVQVSNHSNRNGRESTDLRHTSGPLDTAKSDSESRDPKWGVYTAPYTIYSLVLFGNIAIKVLIGHPSLLCSMPGTCDKLRAPALHYQ